MESPMPELRLPRPILPLPLIKSMENDEIAIKLHKVARRLYEEIEKQKKYKKRHHSGQIGRSIQHYTQDEVCNRTFCWLPFS
jgi:RIO-like serine/threonine protein kinase|tara:strand:+ start:231 stop:476 length:246 start_codon:yes stop_codon:yes gene_type:complete